MASQALSAQAAAPTHTFTTGDGCFLLDGKPFTYRAGEIHFSRIPPEYWEHRLKMMKAMGLNAVSIYLFWNLVEPKPGEFNWTGLADAARFCRLAQEQGLWVILRPGPYVCAEWDEGGHPWWLLKNEKVGWRSNDPAYLQPALRYLKEVGRVLAPLQITHGGPIITYQVENEYGGNNKEYISALRQAAIDNGFNVPLTFCNPPGKEGSRFAGSYRDDLLQTANFGRGGAATSFEILKRFKKTGPYACGEFYPGWFDSWGRKHIHGSTATTLADLEFMLKNGYSFSIYMAHGGTNFGFWAGAAAGPPYKPLCTSYDYDAPITESGLVTEKYKACRELFSKYLQPGEQLPEIPAPIPTISVPEFALQEASLVRDTQIPAHQEEAPKTMESYDQGYGAILYRAKLPAGPEGDLSVKEVHDLGYVQLDGVRQGILDRRQGLYTIHFPARAKSADLEILVEAMGRPNGGNMYDRKGLHAPVLWSSAGARQELKGWSVYPLPLDPAQLSSLKYSSKKTSEPAFLRGSFELKTLGDTFLDTRKLGKGMLWVNGHNLGRYWNIGPQQTLFCPGAWLKAGRNEVVVIEYLGTRTPVLAGLPAPILDELHPELDFAPPVANSPAK